MLLSQRVQRARDPPGPSQGQATPRTSKKDTCDGIKAWLNTYRKRDSMSSTEAVQEAARLLEAVDTIWNHERANNLVTGPEGDVEIKQTLAMLSKSIKQLENKVDSKPTYAQMAQKAPSGPAMVRLGQGNVPALRNVEENRRMKTLILKVSNTKEKEAVRAEHPKDLLEKLERAMGDNRKPAGLKRLPSGDLELQMTSVENRRWAETHTDWTKSIAASASTVRRSYAVMAHGVRVADVDVSNQSEAIMRILSQNHSLHKNAQISRVAWPKKAIELKKPFSSLIIETSAPTTANDFIKNGLIFNHEIKTCEYFCKESRIVQCFNCQKYGHIGKVCGNPTRCGHCAGSHPTRECSAQGKESRKCAACNKSGHEAWSRECQERAQRRWIASERFANRPVFHPVEEEKTTFSAGTAEIPATDPEDRGRKRTRSLSSQNSEDIYGATPSQWIQVESSAPEGQVQDWSKILDKSRSKSIGEMPKRPYIRTKITKTSNKKSTDSQDNFDDIE